MISIWDYYLFSFIVNACFGFVVLSQLRDIRYYEIIEPHLIYNGRRFRRHISTFSSKTNKHADSPVIKFTGHNRSFSLNLKKNEKLITDSFINFYQHQKAFHQSSSLSQMMENCFYQGDDKSSNVALSTCYGLDGIVRDKDGEEFIIEPLLNGKQKRRKPIRYILYKSRDIMETKPLKCGTYYAPPKTKLKKNHFPSRVRRASRLGRSHHMKYVEVFLILDHLEYVQTGSLKATYHRGLQILNLVDTYYMKMNTRIVTSGIMVWNDKNEVPITSNAEETLGAIEDYTKDVLRGKMKLHFDNVQLISGQNWGGVAGLAGIGEICSPISASISKDHYYSVYRTANTVAHELGHNMGLPHLTRACACRNGPCVMQGAVPYFPCRGFADCTHEEYKNRMDSGELDCLLE